MLGAGLPFAFSTLALATTPYDVKVVPVYSIPPGVRLSWIETGGVKNYEISRSIDGVPGVERIATIPGGANGHKVDHLDKNLDADLMYTYRIQVCPLTGSCFNLDDSTTSPRVVWPISGGREVVQNYNEVVGWQGIGEAPAGEQTATGFHMGVDLQKTTPAGEEGDDVLAPRGGVVVPPNLSVRDDGSIAIKVDVGGGHFEYDSFNHIATGPGDQPPVAAGDVVQPGQKIAEIGTLNGFPGNFAKHVHFMSERNPIPPGQQRIIRHPLSTFTEQDDRDPGGTPPALFDENKDGKIVLFRDHGAGTLINYDYATTPLHGDVDVAVEVMDEQGGSDPRVAPLDLGYWIEGPLPPAEQLDDVKSATHAYRLFDFRVEYFGGIPGSVPRVPCEKVADITDAANAGCRGMTDPSHCVTRPPGLCSSVIKEGTVNWAWPVLHHYIVTHAKGETGAHADVDALQYWRTAAKDDGAPVVSTHANYAGLPTTTKAWEARFPDGDYTIHVLASDFVTSINLPIRDNRFPPGPAPGIRLENFAPFVKEIVIARDADGLSATSAMGLPGCEDVLHHYRHTPPHHYPRPQDLKVSELATTIVRSGQKLCTKILFSEPVGSVTVDLVRDRGTGAAVAASGFTGTPSKTHNADDTWTGSVTLPVDASGNSDGGPASDEHDVAIRIQASDRRDAFGAMRPLDRDGDGSGDAGGDVNHVFGRLDLSPPTATINVDNP